MKKQQPQILFHSSINKRESVRFEGHSISLVETKDSLKIVSTFFMLSFFSFFFFFFYGFSVFSLKDVLEKGRILKQTA